MSDSHHPHDDKVTHPFHLVDPSPWPLVASLFAGLLAAGTVMWMHNVTLGGWFQPGLKGTLLGLAGVLFVMWMWWRDVIKESVTLKLHTPVAKIGLRYGMALFIASEVMFFVAFFWAFFTASFYPMEATGHVWPPVGITPFNPLDVPLIMTLILLLSGTTVTWAHHAILEGKNKEAAKALGITVGLGFFFTCFQIYEYTHAHFGWNDGVIEGRDIYSSNFYMATGFHGLHVLIGTLFLAVCWFRTVKGHFSPKSHFGFEAAAWYWHFVDVVWLFLFIAIYWWGAGAAVAGH
jgi:cytochrome c oxidase subunit 3